MAGACLLLSAAFAVVNRRQRKRNRRIRERLAVFAIQGRDLIQKCHARAKGQADPPDEELNKWNEEAVDYLTNELGSDYAMRFISHHGLPTGFTVLGPPYSGYESAVETRLARLNEFMAELANTA
jgi:hypothetical protein